jgi:hydrogenase expression/formation protein HypC
MCLAVPGRVVEIVDEARNIATLEVAGVRRNVNIGLLQGGERPKVGDWVLFHVGMALAKIDETEAIETLLALEAITRDPLFNEVESSSSSADSVAAAG